MCVHPFHKSQEQGEIKLHKKIERYEWSKRNTRINYLDIRISLYVYVVLCLYPALCPGYWPSLTGEDDSPVATGPHRHAASATPATRRGHRFCHLHRGN